MKDVQRINKSDYLVGIGGKGGNRIAERWVGETHFLQNHENILPIFKMYVRKRIYKPEIKLAQTLLLPKMTVKGYVFLNAYTCKDRMEEEETANF